MEDIDEMGIRGDVEEILIECIGDDQFLEDEDSGNVDLFEEYNLDIYGLVEIVQALHDRFGIDLYPTDVERDDINTVNKVVALVEELMTEL